MAGKAPGRALVGWPDRPLALLALPLQVLPEKPREGGFAARARALAVDPEDQVLRFLEKGGSRREALLQESNQGVNRITNRQKEDSRMKKKIAPSERKAQEIQALVQGQLDAQSGEELLSTLGRLSTERVLPEAVEEEQAAALGRGRYERGTSERGYRNGDENGTLKTAEGVVRVEAPQIRGRQEPYRSPLWSQVATTSDVLKRLIVEMYAGGLSQRDLEFG